jgi:hypothetical protein
MTRHLNGRDVPLGDAELPMAQHLRALMECASPLGTHHTANEWSYALLDFHVKLATGRLKSPQAVDATPVAVSSKAALRAVIVRHAADVIVGIFDSTCRYYHGNELVDVRSTIASKRGEHWCTSVPVPNAQEGLPSAVVRSSDGVAVYRFLTECTTAPCLSLSTRQDVENYLALLGDSLVCIGWCAPLEMKIAKDCLTLPGSAAECIHMQDFLASLLATGTGGAERWRKAAQAMLLLLSHWEHDAVWRTHVYHPAVLYLAEKVVILNTAT